MEVLTTIFTIIQVILSVAIIGLVLMQESKSTGLSGAIAGGAETFFGKNRGHSMEGLLRKLTIICAAALAVTTIILIIVQ